MKELIRRYNIIFNTRNIEDISGDYYSDKWISKEELHRLFVHEKEYLMKQYARAKDEYVLLFDNFNAAAHQKYN